MNEEIVNLDGLFEEWSKDPLFMEELAKARAQTERAYQRDCPWGQCEVNIDPLDNTLVWTIGPVGCGCDNLSGWKSKYYDGLPKPGWPAKVKGRHGGRIARSRRRTAELANLHRELVSMWHA